MILVDTSVWIDFFRGRTRAGSLEGLLEDNEVLLHSSVLGELVLGGLGTLREAVVADLEALFAHGST